VNKEEKENRKHFFILSTFWIIYAILTVKLYMVVANKFFH